ncbi:ATP phosphoribosyltransferase regulatory subunit [Erythromicrobium ramosum]|uniref:ATP phosphoribosyltransferase regulatory subunit n=1 Tax=Erythrobacter ramosus TaxID=35811 RepID=A0A6I4UNC7_9SPHN|nr:ATP phosphoribosyltransferase regulatory subunit [Erythrobacter ramosus]MBB3777151.1 ATP phosphoribosyltransferase regulatory subunit [Erythrobacter ramosus]MXP39906.1 ATP phosphoribosyltransferase regulatory subunit [Erythrobacter ramosus]
MTQPNDLLPEGLEDRLPLEAARITAMMRACLDVLDAHGYDRVRPPLLEFEASLAGRMAGAVAGEARAMFRFVDPASLRTLALRSDMTPQVGRIAATSLKTAARPLRLAYCGDTVVIKASQLDPARERLQLGAELIGSDSVAAASEAVMLAVDALTAAGLTGISVDFTLPDLVDTLSAKAFPLSDGQIEAVRRELDTKDAGGLKAAGGAAYLPLLYATGPFETALAALRDVDAGGALKSRLDGLEAIAAHIGDAARITLDPTERHGFEYQSWFGFTLYAEGLRRAAGRGGTYRIAGSDEAATGFTLYLDRLADAAPQPEAARTCYLPLGHDRAAAAKLRAEGWRTRAQLAEGEDAPALRCGYILTATGPVELEQP